MFKIIIFKTLLLSLISFIFLERHLFSVMLRLLHLEIHSMGAKNKKLQKPYVGMLSTFHKQKLK